jgi:hypothetical protein
MLRERYAEVLFALDRDADALRYFQEARGLFSKPEDISRIRRRELLTALYVPPSEGFTKALEAAEALERDPANRSDPWVKVWHVSALGQQHAWLKQHLNDAEAANVAAAVKRIVQEIIQLVPSANDPIRVFLRQLIDPERFDGDPGENDLASLRSDSAVYNLVTSGLSEPSG